jgi:hypothetical protein
MTGEVMQGVLGDRRSPSSALCKSAAAKRETSTYLVWRNKKAPLHARESAYTNSLWAYVWRMDRHRSESNVVLSPPGGGFEPKTFVS